MATTTTAKRNAERERKRRKRKRHLAAQSPLQDNNNTMPFPRCHINSLEASRLPNENNLDPCVLHYLEPIPNNNNNTTTNSNTTTTTTILTLVQVTPHNCPDHRDGAVVGVTVVNNDNNGLGYSIGSSSSSSSSSHQHYVSVQAPLSHFVSVCQELVALIIFIHYNFKQSHTQQPQHTHSQQQQQQQQ